MAPRWTKGRFGWISILASRRADSSAEARAVDRFAMSTAQIMTQGGEVTAKVQRLVKVAVQAVHVEANGTANAKASLRRQARRRCQLCRPTHVSGNRRAMRRMVAERKQML